MAGPKTNLEVFKSVEDAVVGHEGDGHQEVWDSSQMFLLDDRFLKIVYKECKE